MHILVIEDDQEMASFVQRVLSEAGHTVDTVHDGESGLNMARSMPVDLLIVDRMLPKKSGVDLVREFRDSGGNAPALFLSALGDVDHRVEGLQAGGDDYLTKPFAFSELLARIRVLLRRGKTETKTTLEIADLTLDLVSHKVRRGNEEIELTGKEYSLLEYFMRNQEKVLTRTMIAEHVWDYNFDTFTNVIDVYVNHLRKKIDKNFPAKLLHTLRGVGYVMKV